MCDVMIISDTHFTHKNILTFMLPNGSRMRPFASVEEMDELMVNNWNRVVSPRTKVYHLGDVVMHKRYLPIMARLNGRKRLVRGNHDSDDIPTREYLKYFEEVYGSRLIANLLMTHIPVHPESIKPTWTNIHGHTHSNQGALALGPKYFNVCVEMINYTPISLEDLTHRIKVQQWQYDETMRGV